MFLQGNSVRTHCKRSLRNEERSPPRSLVVIAGPCCREHWHSTWIFNDSRRGAGCDSSVVISWTFFSVVRISRDRSRAIELGMTWRKGSSGDRPLCLHISKSMGEGIERSRYTRVLSAFSQSREAHNDDRDVKISLQARHTWVSAIVSSSLTSLFHESGMRMRTSGGILLIGASLLLQDRIRRRTSEASCSRAWT